MRAAIYARVSTLIGQSPEMQLAELREYASRRGWEIVGEYVDCISGSTEMGFPSAVHLRGAAQVVSSAIWGCSGCLNR
jgi:Resolvase, N terminal domain